MPIAAEESDLNLVDSAFKLLTSRDEMTTAAAKSDLFSTCQFRNKRQPTDDDLGKFMSGERIGDFVAQSNRHSNIWTLARAASRRLGVEWTFENHHPSVHFQELTLRSSSRRKIMFSIRDRLRTARTQALINEYSHQDKTSRAWTPRHNSVVVRIVNAVRPKAQILYENQRIPGFTCRPDLVISYKNVIYIVDATVAFENRREAFDQARERKFTTNAHLIDHFKTPSNSVQIVPIAVGALGSWDPRNEAFLKKFCSNSYIKLMAKLYCSDVLRWSRDIYIEHLSGIRQYDPT
ncbi:hypothetical protein AVEN_250958-1 [Araneus ventricosus]|uniref:Uncharacterized protein n=1 Tax=Araneus ventricosus TaxID=182803 RepID=A0A4Y2P2R1_ARAVE|nr:hypothetical protein AVEN_250958-1 [Araneus ventricosus]